MLKSRLAVTCCALLPLSTAWAQQDNDASELTSVPAQEEASPYMSSWLTQHLNLIGSHDTRYGPQPIDDVYLEYEFMGRTGPLDLYGYIDMPKVLGIGNSADSGVWDDGSPLFWELEPRLSIDHMLGKDLGFGPFKEFYLAADDIFDLGHNRDGRQHTLYIGLGTDLETHSRVNLSFNIYGRRQFENYRASNENSWDGYRAQVKYIVPLTRIADADLTWVGFTNYDFGSNLAKDNPGVRTSTSWVSTNVLSLSWTHWAFSVVGRYFHNGGNFRSGADLGGFDANSTGWGEYFIATYSF